MPTFNESSVECRIFTFKEGALSALAHDLELDVDPFTLEIEAIGAGRYKLLARFPVESVGALHAMKDGQPTDQLSESDLRKIDQTIAKEVLDGRRYPEIVYEGTATANGDDEGADGFTLTGELTLQGRRRPLTMTAHLQEGRMRVETTLHQPDFGIQPYRALLGALKLRPDVKVRVSMPWPLPA